MIKKFRHLIEYSIVFILIKILCRLGIDNSSKFMGWIARKIGPYLPTTKVAQSNLIHTLKPDHTNEIITQLWDNFGRFIGEIPYIQTLSNAEMKQRVSIEGLEHIEKFIQAGQPCLFFTGHFANWEIALRRMASITNLAVVSRNINNPYLENIMKNIRSNFNVTIIPKNIGFAKQLMLAIRDKRSILMLVDQKMNEGISVPFFGRNAMTAYGIAKLALKLNYPIIPGQIIRLKGAYFKIILHPQLKLSKIKNDLKGYYSIMLLINQMLELWIKQNPGQWFWFHNRWGKKGVFDKL